MRVDVHSLTHAQLLEPRENTVVISIRSPGAEPAQLNEGWEEVLRLWFDDVVKVPTGPIVVKDLTLFSEEHAQQIHEFVESHLDKDFVIHCEAGVSRSVAVGLYLHDVYGADLLCHEIPGANPSATTNSRVHRALLRKHWMEQLSR